MISEQMKNFLLDLSSLVEKYDVELEWDRDDGVLCSVMGAIRDERGKLVRKYESIRFEGSHIDAAEPLIAIEIAESRQ